MTGEDFDYLIDHDPTGLLNEINRLEGVVDTLSEMLLFAVPYVEEGETFNKPTRRGLSKSIKAALAHLKES